jgi:hypothetical protein
VPISRSVGAGPSAPSALRSRHSLPSRRRLFNQRQRLRPRVLLLLTHEAVGKSCVRNAALRSQRWVSEQLGATASGRTAIPRRIRWPIWEPTLRCDPAGSPGIFPTASHQQRPDRRHVPIRAFSANSSSNSSSAGISDDCAAQVSMPAPRRRRLVARGFAFDALLLDRARVSSGR